MRKVVEVVGRDGLQAAFAGDLRELDVELLLGVARVGHHALVLQLDVEVARLEAAGELLGPGHRVVVLHVVEQARHDAGDAGRGADDALAVLLQHGKGGAGLVVEVVDMGLAHQLDEVVVAVVVLGEQDHVVEAGLALALELVVGGEVDLAAEDGLDLLARFLFERRAGVFQFGHAAHDAVVGDGDRGHPQVGGAFDHVLHMRRAVEQRVFSMIVQVNERHGNRLRYVLESFRPSLYQPHTCSWWGNRGVCRMRKAPAPPLVRLTRLRAKFAGSSWNRSRKARYPLQRATCAGLPKPINTPFASRNA